MTARRKYEETHPWVSFQLDLGRAEPALWTLLGQAVAICRHIAAAALPPGFARELHVLYLSKGARATTAIEGNTLSEEQVRARIEGRLELPPSQEYLQHEVDNILRACEDIWSGVREGNPSRLTSDLIRTYNRRVLERLESHLEEGIVPGEIPACSVGVGRYRGAPREDCDFLLDRLSAWLEEESALPFFAIEDDRRIASAILRAMLVHLYIAWIHPFGDGNGRTARLLEFMMLARAGVPSPSAHLFSNHYHFTRTRYYRELDRSSQANSGKGDVLGFMVYALEGFVDGLRDQCRRIQQAQLDIAWEHLVYEVFRMERRSEALERRRELVLVLGRHGEPVQRGQIADLDPSLARRYAVKTGKTLTRDLNWLAEKGLVERSKKRWKAQINAVRAFLPYRARL